MWTDYYLKFPTYEHFYSAMPAELLPEASASHATDIIGTLYHTQTYEAQEGFHVNLRLRTGTPLPPELLPYNLPTPTLPKRVFA